MAFFATTNAELSMLPMLQYAADRGIKDAERGFGMMGIKTPRIQAAEKREEELAEIMKSGSKFYALQGWQGIEDKTPAIRDAYAEAMGIDPKLLGMSGDEMKSGKTAEQKAKEQENQKMDSQQANNVTNTERQAMSALNIYPSASGSNYSAMKNNVYPSASGNVYSAMRGQKAKTIFNDKDSLNKFLMGLK